MEDYVAKPLIENIMVARLVGLQKFDNQGYWLYFKMVFNIEGI